MSTIVKDMKNKPATSPWHFRSNHISSDKVKQMMHILHKSCPKLAKDFCDTLAHICAIQMQYRVPLSELILGTYHQELKAAALLRLSVQKFIDHYPLFNHLKKEDPDLFAKFAALIPILHKRFAKEPSLTDIQRKIKDDLNQYIDMEVSFHKLIQMSIKDVESSVIAGLPIRYDLVILPRNMETVSGDDDDDSEESKEQINIGDLRSELESLKDKYKFKYYDHTIKSTDDINWNKVFRAVFNEARRKLGITHFKQFRRYVVVVDRREQFCSDDIHIYVFQVPGQRFHPEYYQYLSIINFYFSERFVLPKSDGNHISLYEKSCNIFCISYNLMSMDNINVYWYFNGFQLRFEPEDMINIWPLVFVANEDEISMSQNDILSQRFRSHPFERFYRETTGKELSISVMQGVRDCDETQDGEVQDDVQCGEVQDEETKTLGNMCKYLERQLSRTWPDEVKQVIKIIDEFEELEEVLDDISMDVDSEILMYSDDVVTAFQQQLQDAIQRYAITVK